MAERRIIIIEDEEKPQGWSNEIWKPIPGYKGYEASDHGRIRSVNRKIMCLNRHGNYEWRRYSGKILSPGFTSAGYLHVQIGKGGYDYSGCDVHRLVMLAFVGPYPSPNHEIAHFDGNPANNHLTNLRYATYEDQYSDRVRHGRSNRGEKHYFARLTEEMVREIRKSDSTIADLSRKYKMSKTTIYQIRNRLTWRWLDADT